MTNLSTRAEQAKPDETRGLLELLMLSIPDTMRWGEPRRKLWNARLDCEAYLDAAMMLMPEGWSYTIMRHWAEVRHPIHRAMDCVGRAATPALALIAAIARSIEP